MSFNSASPKVIYTAFSGQTIFSFLFKIYASTDIKVYQNDVLLLSSDYTVVINGDLGGSVTLNSGAAISDSIVLSRALPTTRATEYQTSGDLTATTLNDDQNYQTYLLADKAEELSNCYRNETIGTSNIVPAPIPGNVLKWDATGTKLINDGSGIVVNSTDTLTVNTIAELRVMTATPETVYVTGYHTAGDGAFGSHFFRLVNSAGVDNGGTIIVPTGVTTYHYALQYSGAVNVRWFGADESRTDNHVPIQGAVNSALLSGSVYIPKGNYKLSNIVSIINPVKIFGDSTGLKVKLGGTGLIQTDQTKSIFVISASLERYEFGQYGITGVTFRDLSMTGTSNAVRSLSAIRMDTSVNGGDYHVRELLFDNLTIRNFTKGIDLEGIVYLNSFYNISTMYCNIGISITKGSASDNGGQNRFYSCSMSQGDIALSYLEDGSAGDLSIFGCTLSENNYGLKIGEDVSFYIYGSIFERNSTVGIYVEIKSESNPSSDASRSIVGNKFILGTKSIYINKTAVAISSGVNFPLLIDANTFLETIAVESSTAITQKTLVLGSSNCGIGGAGILDSSQLVNFKGTNLNLYPFDDVENAIGLSINKEGSGGANTTIWWFQVNVGASINITFDNYSENILTGVKGYVGGGLYETVNSTSLLQNLFGFNGMISYTNNGASTEYLKLAANDGGSGNPYKINFKYRRL